MAPTLKVIRTAMKQQPPLEQVGSGLTNCSNVLNLNRRSAETSHLNGPLHASISKLSVAKSPVYTKQLMDLKPPVQYMTSEQFAKNRQSFSRQGQKHQKLPSANSAGVTPFSYNHGRTVKPVSDFKAVFANPNLSGNTPGSGNYYPHVHKHATP